MLSDPPVTTNGDGGKEFKVESIEDEDDDESGPFLLCRTIERKFKVA